MRKNIAIIGGGILGLSIAYKLSVHKNNYNVTVFEKERDVGFHQSGRNSGVLHCGLSYKPKSLKAELAVLGIREMINFCRVNEVKYDQCGKIVVATNPFEERTLINMAKNGNLNGLVGLDFLSPSEIRKREPHINGLKALLVPEEGIVDYKEVMRKLVALIKLNNSSVLFNAKVDSIVRKKEKLIIEFNQKKKEFDLLVNSSGLQSDRIFSRLTGNKRPLRIIPFRGEYLSFKNEYKEMVNHLVYPVPNPDYPFLGVHFTRMINGDREVGPNAVFSFKREGYKTYDFSLKDAYDSLSYSGLHAFIKKNFKFALSEFQSSLSKEKFIEKARNLMPDINDSMLTKGGAGVRAQAMNSTGDLLMDFRIERFGRQIHVLNAPSPGATASFSIANYIINNYISN